MDANTQARDGEPPSLIDVLAVPGVGASVLSHLWRDSRRALRLTCSAVCALVDQHVDTITVSCVDQESVLIAERLARKGLTPKEFRLPACDLDGSSPALTALFATVPHQFFAHLQWLVLRGSLSEDTLQAVMKAAPSLPHLTNDQGVGGHNIKLLAATPLLSLRTLDIPCLDLSNAQYLTSYTQLKELTLGYSEVKGASALAQLTALTSLRLNAAAQRCLRFSPTEQSQLGSVLAALKGLRSLQITCLPPGPMTQAVSQLAALTEVVLLYQEVVENPGPIVLPSALSLRFQEGSFTPNHLCQIHAPQLQRLCSWYSMIAAKPHDLDTLRWLCRGVLRAASTLALDLKGNWSEQDTVTLMAVLHQDWQPSAQAMCSAEHSIVQHHDGWRLDLHGARCSRQCLSLVPVKLNSLYLKYCNLDPASLDHLAQVSSLRMLWLQGCNGISVTSLERLFSTSVQGCLLFVHVSGRPDQQPAKDCQEMRAQVLAERGSRDTPVLWAH